jgi:hypothetical protein
MLQLKKMYAEVTASFSNWSRMHLVGLFVFNIILMILILLRSGGYFTPFFTISINVIVFISIVLSVFLLNVNSAGIFTLSIIFWLFAGLLKILGIDIWAERVGIYTFQALLVGLTLLLKKK